MARFTRTFAPVTFVWAKQGGLDAAGGGQAFAAQLRHLVDLQRRQVADDAAQQVVRQLRIAGQARPVQVRGDDAALHRAVDAVARPVARAADHLRERLAPRAENRSAAVVFEARQSFGADPGAAARDTTSPMVRFSCGDVVTSSSPTPSTRSPDDVSYQCPST